MASVRDPGLSTLQEGSYLNRSVHADRIVFLLFQTRLKGLPRAAFVLASLLSTSLSILESEGIVYPR